MWVILSYILILEILKWIKGLVLNEIWYFSVISYIEHIQMIYIFCIYNLFFLTLLPTPLFLKGGNT